MTKRQRIEHKIGNAQRKARLLVLYYKADWKEKCWLKLGGLSQNGKYTVKTGIPIYDSIAP